MYEPWVQATRAQTTQMDPCTLLTADDLPWPTLDGHRRGRLRRSVGPDLWIGSHFATDRTSNAIRVSGRVPYMHRRCNCCVLRGKNAPSQHGHGSTSTMTFWN